MKPIALTPGDPAGIGPDIVISLCKQSLDFPLVVIADPRILLQRAKLLSQNITIREYDPGTNESFQDAGEITVLNCKCDGQVIPGEASPDNARYVLHCLDQAINGCLAENFSAMVTGPVSKAMINQAGLSFTGHTEYIAHRCNDAFPVMMLMNDSFRVALVTTHLPLAKVTGTITPKLLENVFKVVHQDLISRFNIRSPRLLICGLNPHAGEQGYLGNEEIEFITPVVRALNQQGMDITGPVSADTAFTAGSLRTADVVVCMYHDQGLPVLKSTGFGNIVNVTLGLPIIRTSVDHGTAYDLAGTGRADAGSLRAALECAVTLSRTSTNTE